MKLNWDKIIRITGIVGMINGAFGMIGGIILHSAIIMGIGLGIWALALIIILSKALHNMMS